MNVDTRSLLTLAWPIVLARATQASYACAWIMRSSATPRATSIPSIRLPRSTASM